jgi:hypothetical protein
MRCWRCDYDLRATANDGACPECGASVAETTRQVERQRWRATAASLIPVGFAVGVVATRSAAGLVGERAGVVAALCVALLGAIWAWPARRSEPKLDRLMAWCYLALCPLLLTALVVFS